MANKVFKGFKLEVEGQFTAETGYLYFVRTNTGATDGYLQFDGKKYGTAADAAAELDAKIGTLPEGYDSVVEYIADQVSAITGDYATKEELGALSGRVDGVETALGTLSGRVDDIEADYLKAENITALTNSVEALEEVSAGTRLSALEAVSADSATKEELGTLSGRVDDLEAIDADTRLDTLEEVSAGTRINILETSAATKEELGAVEERVDALEEVSADTRLSALEAISGETHTHDNKAVLDGISAEDVAAWDAAEDNAIGAASAYTDSKYDSAVTASELVLSAYTGESATEGYLKTYEIFQGGDSVGKIDIPKDLVVSSGEVVTVEGVKYLRLYIANDPEHPVDIAISDLAHVYTEGSGITIGQDDKISAKVVDANGLFVDGDGIKVRLATAESAGTISAADFVKLGTIDASAQTNVIEEVKVDGTALTISDKSVNIVLSGLATNDTVGTLSGRVDVLEVSAATKSELGTLSGRVDDLEAIDADTRLDNLEASAHTHANKDVLDDITSADTESWDAALQEVVSSSTIDVTTKADGKQTISVKVSAATGNTISAESDGLFAAIYYDGDDSE